jgi:hypothetical protein
MKSVAVVAVFLLAVGLLVAKAWNAGAEPGPAERTNVMFMTHDTGGGCC